MLFINRQTIAISQDILDQSFFGVCQRHPAFTRYGWLPVVSGFAIPCTIGRTSWNPGLITNTVLRSTTSVTLSCGIAGARCYGHSRSVSTFRTNAPRPYFLHDPACVEDGTVAPIQPHETWLGRIRQFYCSCSPCNTCPVDTVEEV